VPRPPSTQNGTSTQLDVTIRTSAPSVRISPFAIGFVVSIVASTIASRAGPGFTTVIAICRFHAWDC
jgi:uncharacterized membrane protein